MAVAGFTKKTLDLLDKERATEIQENSHLLEHLSAKELQRRGVCLLKMCLKSRRSGLFGRLLGVFGPQPKPGDKSGQTELPSHNFTPGDIIGVNLTATDTSAKPILTGIVSSVATSQITLAFDESQDLFSLDDNHSFKLTKLANDVTYIRLKNTLIELEKYRGGPSQRLIDTFFCLEEISPPFATPNVKFVNECLDESQREAVRFGLSQPEVAIIHGPPGTGKTTTIVELIIQAVRQEHKVLASAPSNIAVDNLVERLAHYKQRVVRIGHPARLLSHLQKYSLDALVSGTDEKGIAQDVKEDLHKALNKLKKTRSQGERQSVREEIKYLKKELSRREEAATVEILSRADVVLTTLTSSTNEGPLKLLKEGHFDLLVIDECSQALEVACWIALLRVPRCVLAGDHLQLPPTILSHEAAKSGLEITLMERLLKLLSEDKEKDVVRMLTTQYRMHEDIMQWSSHQLYQDKLTAHPSVAKHLLRDLKGISECEDTCSPLLLIDTAGCDLTELDLPEEISKGNEGEADVVAAHVEQLIETGLAPVDIAIITPYNLQVELLRGRLSTKYPDLEIKSVDGFQGREKEAVVISMVRSNSKGEVGFLAERRRINVAVTRARRHLTIVCDSLTVSHDAFIKSLVDYMMDKGQVLSGHQYLKDGVSAAFSYRPARLEQTASMDDKQVKHKQITKPTKEKVLLSKAEKTVQYKEILNTFMNDPTKEEIEFPASLNSHDRLVIHEVCDQLGLEHVSTGEGKDRRIRISKSTDKTERTSGKPEPVNKMSELRETPKHTYEDHLKNSAENDFGEDKQIDKEKSKRKSPKKKKENSQTVPEKRVIEVTDATVCKNCGKNVPKSNYSLHEVRCSKTQSTIQQSQILNEAKKKTKEKTKKVSQVQKVAEVLNKVDNDDFDAMLAKISELDSKCAFKKCKTLTNTLGRNCEFCSRRFCLSHLMPEIHGCGDAAKVHARRVISREGVLHNGSGIPNKKPNPDKRAQLEHRLDKKLSEMAGKRGRNHNKK